MLVMSWNNISAGVAGLHCRNSPIWTYIFESLYSLVCTFYGSSTIDGYVSTQNHFLLFFLAEHDENLTYYSMAPLSHTEIHLTAMTVMELIKTD